MSDSELDEDLLRLAGIDDTQQHDKQQQDSQGQQNEEDQNRQNESLDQQQDESQQGEQDEYDNVQQIQLGKRNLTEENNFEEDIEDFDNIQALPEDRNFKYQPNKKHKSQKIDESETEDEESELEFGQNPDDELFHDDEDKKKLMRMPEFEREMILQERAEKLEEERERLRILNQTKAVGASNIQRQAKPVQKRQQESKKKAADNLDDWDDEEGTEDEEEEDGEQDDDYMGGSPLQDKEQDLLADQASEEGEVAEDGEQDSDWERKDDFGRQQKSRGRSAMAFQSRAGSVEEESGYDDDNDQKVEVEANYEQVKAMQVHRSTLEKWIDEPYFEKTIPGAVVRMAGGESTHNHDNPNEPKLAKNQYMVGVVKELMENKSRPYKFGPRSQLTSKYLSVDFGYVQPKVVEMNMMSNQDVTNDEYINQNTLRMNRGATQITTQDYEKVKKNLQDAKDYKYTAEDIRKRVEEKRQQGKLASNPAIEKARLERLKQYYVDRHDEAKVQEIELQLVTVNSQLEKNRQMFGQKMSFAMNQNRLQRGFNAVILNDENQKDTSRRRSTLTNSYFKTNHRQVSKKIEELEQADKKVETKPQQIKNIGDLIMDIDLNVDLDLIKHKKRVPQIIKSLLGNKASIGLNEYGAKTAYKIYTIQEYNERFMQEDVAQ